MRRDPRLRIDLPLREHFRLVKENETKTHASLRDAAAEILVAPLVAQILAGDRRSLPFPQAAEERFRAAFEAISVAVDTTAESDHRSVERTILERRVASRLGREAPPSVSTWGRVLEVLSEWSSQEAFLEAIPSACIERSVLEIMRMPMDRGMWLDRISGPGHRHQALEEELDRRRESAADTWSWLDRVERMAEQTHVGEPLVVRSVLLARVPPVGFATWLAMIHPFYAAVVIDNIDDLDLLEALLAACDDASAPLRSRHAVQLLLVRRMLQLWEAIKASLSLVLSMENLADDVRSEHRALLDDWEQRELPQRLRTLVQSVTASTPLGAGAIETMRRLRTDGGRPGVRQDERRTFREALLESVPSSEVSVTISKLLGEAPGTSALLAASKLANRAPTAQSSVVDAYVNWVRTTDFHWQAPLAADELELVAELAACVASHADPVSVARRMLEGAMATSQGWAFKLDAWFDAVPRTAHTLIVVAVASDCTKKKASAGASALFELAWDGLHTWLHDAPLNWVDERVPVAIAYVWACAGKFGIGAEQCSKALGRLDDIRHVLTAATHYAKNSAAQAMPTESQRIVRSMFEDRLEILQRHPHIPAKDLERLTKQVAELTPRAGAIPNSG